MMKIKILWIDDEIDLLKIQILFLEEKGYIVETSNNGYDAIELVNNNYYDIIFLDENMPGLSGLETLSRLKQIRTNTPVVMVTKNEEEDIMDEAIGSKISDYLIKPVNPKQLLLSIKKNVDNNRLLSEKVNSDYQSNFAKLGQSINTINSFAEWAELYKKLVFWDLELNQSSDSEMFEILKHQKKEANNEFVKFIKKNYTSWFQDDNFNKPFLVSEVFKHKIFDIVDEEGKIAVIVIDNLRFDQWKVLEPLISDYFFVEEENIISSILPTSTQYARNSLFAGLLPNEIKQMYPNFWRDESEEGSYNEFEKELLETQIKRFRKNFSVAYSKVLNNKAGIKLNSNIKNYLEKDIVVFVYNFIDILSHAKTDSKMIRELAYTEKSFRDLTKTWFQNSPLIDTFKELRDNKIKTIITTDHGSVHVNNPIKVVGDKNISTNLRYKLGKNLKYNAKEVFFIKTPENIGLPTLNLSSSYIFSLNNDFFSYPNNYNYYVKYYKDTFQHGGISLEEMCIPLITLKPK